MTTPVVIRLRPKYLSFTVKRNGIAGDHQGKHKLDKIGYAKHVARYGEPPIRVRYATQLASHVRMVTARRLSSGPHGKWEL